MENKPTARIIVDFFYMSGKQKQSKAPNNIDL